VLLALAGLFSVSFAAPGAGGDDDSPVLLPPFDVRIARPLAPGKEWLHARVAGFEVITDIEPGRARAMLHDLNLYSAAIRLLWPALELRSPHPPILVLCSERSFLDSFATGAADRGRLTLRGAHRDVSGLIVNAGVRSITIEGNWPAASAMKDYSLKVESSQLLRAAYVDFLFARLNRPLPRWLATGLAEVLADVHISETEISIGRPPASPEKSAELETWEEMRRQLGPGAGGAFGAPAWLEIPPNAYRQDDDGFARQLAQFLLPMEVLLSPDGVAPDDPNGYTWRKQCHAFAHWGLFGDLGTNRTRFVALARHAIFEPVTEQKFASIIGVGYDAFLHRLRSHMESTRAQVIGLRPAPGETFGWRSDFELRTATEAQMGWLLGEAAIAVGKADTASVAFREAFRRGARDGDFLAAFGLAALEGADPAEGIRLLESAVAGRTSRARAYHELARALALSARSASGNVPIDRATEVLLQGIRQAAPAPELPVLLAQLWLASGQTPPAPVTEALREGERRFQGDARLRELTSRLLK
jgi:hypothetical protein